MIIEVHKQQSIVAIGALGKNLGLVSVYCDTAGNNKIKVVSDVVATANGAFNRTPDRGDWITKVKDNEVLAEFSIDDLDARRPIRNGKHPNKTHTPHTAFFFKDGTMLTLEHTSWEQMHIFANWASKQTMYLNILLAELPCNQPKLEFNNTIPERAETITGDDSSARSTESAS